MKITVIGQGYVGLTSAAVYADLGNTVWVVRRDKEKNEALKKGKIPFYEPGLERLVLRNMEAGRFIPTTDYSYGIPQSDIVFICVSTPSKENGSCDLTNVFDAAKGIAHNLSGYTVVVDKSTVPVGTADRVKKIISEYKKDSKAEFDVVSNPEFLAEGTALKNTQTPERTVIGSESERATKMMVDLHRPLGGEIVVTDVRSAEILKYAANCFLALRIAFINEFADVCENVAADIEQVLAGIKLDPRIGGYFFPGWGYGGACFPKDTKALAFLAREAGEPHELVELIVKLNAERAENKVKKFAEKIGGVKNKKVTVLGLSHKKHTDDIRESSAIRVVKALQKQGAKVTVFDPEAMENAKKVLSDVGFAKDAYSACRDSDALFIGTDWPEFIDLDFESIKKLMNRPVIIDGRNLYNPERIKALGFEYIGIGRGR